MQVLIRSDLAFASRGAAIPRVIIDAFMVNEMETSLSPHVDCEQLVQAIRRMLAVRKEDMERRVEDSDLMLNGLAHVANPLAKQLHVKFVEAGGMNALCDWLQMYVRLLALSKGDPAHLEAVRAGEQLCRLIFTTLAAIFLTDIRFATQFENLPCSTELIDLACFLCTKNDFHLTLSVFKCFHTLALCTLTGGVLVSNPAFLVEVMENCLLGFSKKTKLLHHYRQQSSDNVDSYFVEGFQLLTAVVMHAVHLLPQCHAYQDVCRLQLEALHIIAPFMQVCRLSNQYAQICTSCHFFPIC